jgi:hypothetical protein
MIDTFCKIISSFEHKYLQVLLQYKENLSQYLSDNLSDETWSGSYSKCAWKNIVNFLGGLDCCLGSHIQKWAKNLSL